MPPCDSGVVPGRYYDYMLPGTCEGLVDFDGRQWVSELPPPNAEPPMNVWMRLSSNGEVGFIAPTGAVGFMPYSGQPLAQCRG
jgi:hypothetical protein